MAKTKKTHSFIVYDLETGGFHAEKNSVIEVAFIAVVRNKKGVLTIDENLSFESLVLPYNDDLVIEDQALQVNKITMKEIKKYGNPVERIKDVLVEMVQTLNPDKGNRYAPILVGHNIQKFDNKFLSKFLDDIGAPPINVLFSELCIDTYAEAIRLFDDDEKIQSLSLGSLCEYFGITLPIAHRAYDDALANAKLFLKLTEMFQINRKQLLKTIK